MITLYNTVQSIKKRIENLTEEVKKMEEMMIPRVISTEELYHKHETDAGWDLKCITDLVVPAKEVTPLIQTGVRLDIPEGYFGLVKERSSMAAKGIFVLGGVIDSGYRGEVLINLANIGKKEYKVKAGDRIAQLIIIPCSVNVVQDDWLSVSERGEEGFGSTGR